MTEGYLQIPLGVAELLHATLGPLSDVLDAEDHPWAPTIHLVLSEYIRLRNTAVGTESLALANHATYLAAERVCELTRSAVRDEEDFRRWAAEMDTAG